MKKILKITISVLGIIIAGIAILVVAFINDMTPDKDEEENVIAQAEDT